jgi:hypothetical protein
MSGSGRKKPVRLRRKARRVFYKTLHAAVPGTIRRPMRNAVKGPPPAPEEFEAQRKEELARRVESERATLARLKLRAVAEAERETQRRAHERASWIKQESVAQKRDHATEKKARLESERQERRAAAETARAPQQRAREHATSVKEETAGSRHAGAAIESEKAKDQRRRRIAARTAESRPPRRGRPLATPTSERAASIKDGMRTTKRDLAAGDASS